MQKTLKINQDKTLCYLAFYNSLQANIISAVRSGKIIVANSAACKLLGYSKKELLTKSRADILDLNESSIKEMLKKRTANGNVKALVSFIKKGNRAFTCEFSSVVFKDGGSSEISISTIVDMSQSILKQKEIDVQKEKIVADNIVLAKAKSDEEKLDIEGAAKAEYEENFKLIFNSSSDILYDIDLVANKVVLSDAYEKGFGYKIINNTMSKEDVFSHIYPDDKEAVMQDYSRMLASEDVEWKYNFRFLKSDESVANLFTSSVVLRNEDGKALRRIGHLQDISKQIVQEQMNNILKHAKATEVTMSLSQNKKIIILSISDNGVGFDTGKKQKGIG